MIVPKCCCSTAAMGRKTWLWRLYSKDKVLPPFLRACKRLHFITRGILTPIGMKHDKDWAPSRSSEVVRGKWQISHFASEVFNTRYFNSKTKIKLKLKVTVIVDH